MNPINRVDASQAVYKPQPLAPARGAEQTAPTATVRGRDRVELSGVQNFLAVLKANDVRADKVASIRAQIEAGTYETEDKFDIAADRLLEDL